MVGLQGGSESKSDRVRGKQLSEVFVEACSSQRSQPRLESDPVLSFSECRYAVPASNSVRVCF